MNYADMYTVQGYPQRMRLQRRLYRIYLAFFLTFGVYRSCKLVSSVAESFTSPKDYVIVKTRISNSTLKSLYCFVIKVSSFVVNPVYIGMGRFQNCKNNIVGGSRLRGVKGVYKRKYKEGGSKDPTNPCISLFPVSPGYSGQVAAEEQQIQIF